MACSTAERCAAYGDEAPVVTEQTFDGGDAATGGDLPPDELLDLLVPDLEDFYAGLFSDEGKEWDPVDELVFFDPATDEVACGDTSLSEDEAEFAIFYCVDDDNVQADATGLVPTLQDIGDFAVGAEVARQWAFAPRSVTGSRRTAASRR